MKKILLYAMVLFFASCEKDAGLTYSGKSGIYFAYSYNQATNSILSPIRTVEFDQVIYSFGMLDESILKDTAKVVVKVMGKAADHDRLYRVSVNPDSTTAVEGVHYESIQHLQKFKAGKLVDTLKIVVLRKNLNGSHITQENKIIGLKIEQSDDFNVGIARGAEIPLIINNYLSQPKWWARYETQGLYYYHPEKLKILMKFNDAFKNTATDEIKDVGVISTYFSSLRTYLQQIAIYDKETNERVLIDRLVKN